MLSLSLEPSTVTLFPSSQWLLFSPFYSQLWIPFILTGLNSQEDLRPPPLPSGHRVAKLVSLRRFLPKRVRVWWDRGALPGTLLLP